MELVRAIRMSLSRGARFLRTATVGSALTLGPLLGGPGTLLGQSTLTPDAALEELMAGNRRFVANKMTSFEHDLVILKQHTVEKQEPFASVLSCADSRVPVELLFNQTINHIFVNRVAGNVITSEVIASIEYGAAVLGTKVILVLGHANCGAVKATIQAKSVPGQISALYPHIQAAVDQAGSNLEAATKLNAKMQAELLKERVHCDRRPLEGRQGQSSRRVLRYRKWSSEPAF